MTITNPDSMAGGERVDELLRVLADRERRAILSQCREGPTEIFTLEELATQLSTAPSTDEQAVRIRLHHVHLPKLDQTDVLDYDSASRTIEYHCDAVLESLIDTIERHEFTT